MSQNAGNSSASNSQPSGTQPSHHEDHKQQQSEQKKLKFVVGSTNPSKIKATSLVIDELFKLNSDGKQVRQVEIVGVAVKSGVDDQPKSGVETMTGAMNRAKAALAAGGDDADYGIGLEGGIEKVGDLWFECGWCAVAARSGKVGVGSSARFQVAEKIVKRLFAGEELADVVDELSGEKDVRSNMGMMGMVTNGHLPRAECYAHGLKFAFAPFISSKVYWD